MSKRYIETISEEIEIENKKIRKQINEIDENHEVSKFLLIFEGINNNMTSKEYPEEETDGIVTDTLTIICNLNTDLLKNNIDSLSIPKPLKKILKILKIVFRIINKRELTKDAKNSRGGETTEEASETSGDRSEEQRQNSSEE